MKINQPQQQYGFIISVTDCSPKTVVQELGVVASHLR